MGYALTTIIAYGIKIDEEVAKKIAEEKIGDCHVYYRPNHQYGNNTVSQKTPVSPYKQHDFGVGSTVFDGKMWSDNTDSRIHGLAYEEGHDHYLGIYIASNGYAYSDDIKFFTKKVPPEAMINFEMAIKPLMDKYNIQGKPEIQTISQVW